MCSLVRVFVVTLGSPPVGGTSATRNSAWTRGTIRPAFSMAVVSSFTALAFTGGMVLGVTRFAFAGALF